MNAPTSIATVDKPVPMTLAVPTEARHSVEKGSSPSQHSKIDVDTDAEQMRSMLFRMTSNSVDELEGLVSELQEVRDFLKVEGERVQREITNYAQLNQSALAAIKIIAGTIGPWKSTKNSGAGPLLGGHEMEKLSASSGANK